jgi:phosphoglycolate phosphatase
MIRPSLLLWDWDNTLVDGWLSIAAALNAAFTAFAMPHWSIEETRERAVLSLRDVFPTLFGDDWRRAREIFYARYNDDHLDHVRPMPGALDALDAGRAWPQGVVSNKSGKFLRAEVAHLGWSPLFGAVIGAGDAAADKPSAAPILLALSQLNAKATSSVWYLGDTANDMRAARAAGVTAVLVGDAAHDGGVERAGADLHFEHAHGLAARLRALAQGSTAAKM